MDPTYHMVQKIRHPMWARNSTDRWITYKIKEKFCHILRKFKQYRHCKLQKTNSSLPRENMNKKQYFNQHFLVLHPHLKNKNILRVLTWKYFTVTWQLLDVNNEWKTFLVPGNSARKYLIPFKQTQNILVVIRISSNEYWSRTASFAGLCILVLIIHGKLL